MITLPSLCQSKSSKKEDIMYFIEDVDECVSTCVEEKKFEVKDLPPMLCECIEEEKRGYEKVKPIIKSTKRYCFENLILSVPIKKLCGENGPRCRNS